MTVIKPPGMDFSGAVLGQMIVNALNSPQPPSPPTGPMSPSAPAPLPTAPPPTSAQIDGYQTALTAFNNYNSFQAQLGIYNTTVSKQLETWTTISRTIINYIGSPQGVTGPAAYGNVYTASGTVYSGYFVILD